eukprot:CAMPEP_0196577444 /NCGR_PEP_ID=MMETSP1081-20130531/6512_1 /TAXON_ID=36882 /ORGANISM="Pyramimonas amylifera, Strain CCMP720" /LENGTH=292 /DNA_ID=CAMNT_0041896373 /DNA_START=226 /DNA_END=1104 /DNA_ORIENTATION=-
MIVLQPETNLANSRIEPLVDGFESVLARLKGGNQYIDITNANEVSGFVKVLDNFLDPSIAKQVYQTALNSKRPLGGYLTFEGEGVYSGDSEMDQFTREIVEELLNSKHILPEGHHGIMVWCLAADEGNEVPYHIDYPELVRYETNILYPPAYGLVYHCTDETQMEGGDFFAHKGGLDHYLQHGFKGRLKEIDPQDPDWIAVDYKFNRMLVYDGRLPHFSTKVTKLTTGCKRVIWAANVYGPHVGPQVALRPDHSESFVRVVNLYQKLGNKLLARKSKVAKMEKENKSSDSKY